MIKCFSLAAFLSAVLAPCLYANPYENLTPDQSLYQRVKKLGDYGLLDAKDKAILDEGKVVTRIELAFYTEKAKARLEAPSFVAPSPTATPVPQPVVAPPSVTEPPPLALPEPEAPPAAVPTSVPAVAPVVPVVVTPVATPIAPVVTPAPIVTDQIRKEIEQLLKELKAESAYLKTRMSLNDRRIQEQEKEWEALRAVQKEVDSVWKKANKSVGTPHFTTNSRIWFENLNISAITWVNSSSVTALSSTPAPPITIVGPTSASRGVNILEIGMWTDLGGHGSISAGLGTNLSDSNYSSLASPASVYIYNPDVELILEGPLGRWSTHIAQEAYKSYSSLGSFTRGVAPTSLKRFEYPFDVKRWSDDKNQRNWEDYISTLNSNYLASSSTSNAQSTSDRVFSGVCGTGTNLPLLGGDTTMTILIGRMGTSASQTQRWEEALKLSRNFGGVAKLELATQWVNDNFGINPPPVPEYPDGMDLTNVPSPTGYMDMKTHTATLGLSIKPFTLNFEGALSSFYTGVYDKRAATKAIQAPGGQASLSFYPFTVTYFGISENFANFQSKVAMAGIPFDKYGISWSKSDFNDCYGMIGEVDNYVSDRYGWRANFGWTGRQQEFMSKWPSFLDFIVVNLDYSQKKEYVSMDYLGYYVIEPFSILSFYYGEDEGMWGSNLWGGFGPTPNRYREAFTNNVLAERKDQYYVGKGYNEVRYQFILSSERIPLIQPRAFDVNGQPVTYTAATVPTEHPDWVGNIIYDNISDLKTYNYLTLSAKVQFDKILGISHPLYGSLFYTNNVVSSKNIPDLFDQTVYDVTGRVQVVRNLYLIGDYGVETWKSDYTWPLIDYRTDSYGAGLAYDIPWGGAKLDVRFKHIVFKSRYLPANNYEGDQIFSAFKLMF